MAFAFMEVKVRKKLVFAIRHAEDKPYHHQYKEKISLFKPQFIDKPKIAEIEQKHQKR